MQQAFRLHCKKQTVHTTVMIWHYGSANHMNKTVIGTPQCQILCYTFTLCSLPKTLKLCKFIRTVFMTWQKPNHVACKHVSQLVSHELCWVFEEAKTKFWYMPTIPQLLVDYKIIQASFVIHNRV